jgi:hypothetical protein
VSGADCQQVQQVLAPGKGQKSLLSTGGADAKMSGTGRCQLNSQLEQVPAAGREQVSRTPASGAVESIHRNGGAGWEHLDLHLQQTAGADKGQVQETPAAGVSRRPGSGWEHLDLHISNRGLQTNQGG